MRHGFSRHLPPLALALAVLIPSAEVRAQATLEQDVWTPFEWFDGVGSTAEWSGGTGFFLSALDPIRVRIADAFESGDVFDLFVNGTLFGTTSLVAAGVETDAYDGESAWVSPALSRGEFVLGPGDYTLEILVREDAGYGYGTGFIQAGPTPSNVVPEPVSMVLLGTGLAGMGLAARRRRGAERPVC